MDQTGQFRPTFTNPPIIETRIGLQFAALSGFKVGHFGLFVAECVDAENWEFLPDIPSTDRLQEKFGSIELRTEIEEEDDFPRVCMRLVSKDRNRTIQLQPNKLTFGWKRYQEDRPKYEDIKTQFDVLFSKLSEFATRWNLGDVDADLWEVTYVNQIPQGLLWSKVTDWHGIFPGVFTLGGPQVAGFEWTTFNGSWFFEIPVQQGRVMVQMQKAVNPDKDLVLLLKVTARGELGGTGATNWSDGFDLGHQSAIRVFHDLSSPEARAKWGMQS